MNYKVSVIIPVFNAENTLDNAINSILNQTLGAENIELILVDDCSTDNSGKIIKDYASNYSNINAIFLNENSGSPSKPRNVGIDSATAPYLMFLDNDDECFPDYCETLYDKITEKDVDIVTCNHCPKLNNQIYCSGHIEKFNTDEKIIENDEKFFIKLAVWENIFKTSFIKENNIRFPSTLYEDGVFYINCLLNTNKPIIQLLHYPGYINLIENDDSITHKVNIRTLERFFEGYRLCHDLLKEHDARDVEERLFSNFITMILFMLIKLENISEGVKRLYKFERNLDFKINLPSKPLDIINKKIMNKQFKQAKILLQMLGLVYNNKKLKNKIYIRTYNLKPLEV